MSDKINPPKGGEVDSACEVKSEPSHKEAGKQKKLHQLFFPIFFEILFMMLAGMVDTLMLSSVSDQAVGAVGTANTYIGVFIIMFSVISSGMIAVMTQNIGAGRPGVAYQARHDSK